MATKEESNENFQFYLADIVSEQTAAFEQFGYYKRIISFPDAEDISIMEYRGGGPSVPYEPNRNPGYVIVQTAHEEDGTLYHQMTDMGSAGRTQSWTELEEMEIGGAY